MAITFPTVVMTNGVFPPNAHGHSYQPMPYHGAHTHGTRGGMKKLWSIPQNGQYYVFNYGDMNNWMDNIARGIVSFLNGCNEILGKNGQRLAFFPTPANPTDPWHGYPIGSDEIEDDNLVESWCQNGFITLTVKQRILRGNL